MCLCWTLFTNPSSIRLCLQCGTHEIVYKDFHPDSLSDSLYQLVAYAVQLSANWLPG